MSTLALRLIAENKITKDTRLDLGNCGLTCLPPELARSPTSFSKKLLIFDPKPTNPS